MTEQYAPRLTQEEEIELGKRVAAGDMDARNRLVESNLRLVKWCASRFAGRGVEFEDLVQEANIGLMTAADRWDWRNGARFATFALYWIRHYLWRGIQQQARTISVPVNKQFQLYELLRTRDEMFTELGQWPTEAEAAERLPVLANRRHKLTSDQVRDLLECAHVTMSIDQPLTDACSTTLADIMADEHIDALEALIVDGREAVVYQAFKRLRPRQEKVLKMRFGFNRADREHSLVEIAEYFGITRERVRQIEVEALNRLREVADFGAYRPPGGKRRKYQRAYNDGKVIERRMTPNAKAAGAAR